jgi:redox-sensitive bicupin YhaK (pirin superfamily)
MPPSTPRLTFTIPHSLLNKLVGTTLHLRLLSKVMTKKLFGVFGPNSRHWVGDGFHVQNFIPTSRIGDRVSPFLLMDYAGPTEFSASQHRRGVDRHPHRGFETVTVALQGEIEHSDSAGNTGIIGPGDVQWMTAGSGVVHEEKQSQAFAERGGNLEMVQLWVNLRKVDKMAPPGYQSLVRDEIPTIDLPGGKARLISGSMNGTSGPAKTFSPVTLIDAKFDSDSQVEVPWIEGHTAAVLVRKGSIGISGERVDQNSVAVFERSGDSIEFSASAGSEMLLLGGEPIDEPTYFHGPFVMNSHEELSQAIEDYRAGKMG